MKAVRAGYKDAMGFSPEEGSGLEGVVLASKILSSQEAFTPMLCPLLLSSCGEHSRLRRFGGGTGVRIG